MLAHVQFETIHPFLDGDGRLGRLLISLLLWEQKVLREPMLYLSETLEVVKELTAQRRNRLFSYAAYIAIMNRGTEPPG